MFQGVRFGLGLDLSYKYVSPITPVLEPGLRANLVAYWKMEESSGTRYDSHGSNHLTVYSDEPNAIESGGGVIGNSAIQNDLNEYVSLYIAPSPYDAVNSSWSLSFWMSTNDNGDDTNQMFPNAWSNCCLWRIRTHEGDAHQTVEGMIWYDELGAGTAFNANKAGIYEGGFVHVAVTHDLPTKTVRVYYNGIEEHVFVYSVKLSSVSPGNSYENILLSMFAGDSSGIDYPGPGKLDEVGIWERVLTAGEVSALYNNGDGLAYENFSVLGGDDPANAAEPDATAWVLMDGPLPYITPGDPSSGFIGGQSWRKMAPAAPINGKTSYTYGDETVIWNGSVWEYSNIYSGLFASSTDDVAYPWLATWNNSFSAAKITSDYIKTTNYPAVP